MATDADGATTEKFYGGYRWDSLGEYLAMAVALMDHGEKTGNERAKQLGETLSTATGVATYLHNIPPEMSTSTREYLQISTNIHELPISTNVPA